MTIPLRTRFLRSVLGVSMLSGERLLIVEEAFLIALEIQRIVEDANAQQTVFARNFDEVAALADRLNEFDLAIVTPPRPGTSDQVVFDKMVRTGLAVVVCSAVPERIARNEFTQGEFVGKPFTEEELLAACRRALARRQAG